MANSKRPLLRATVDVDWIEGGKKKRLTPDDEPTRDVPRAVAAWCTECGALVEVERKEDGSDR